MEEGDIDNLCGCLLRAANKDLEKEVDSSAATKEAMTTPICNILNATIEKHGFVMDRAGTACLQGFTPESNVPYVVAFMNNFEKPVTWAGAIYNGNMFDSETKTVVPFDGFDWEKSEHRKSPCFIGIYRLKAEEDEAPKKIKAAATRKKKVKAPEPESVPVDASRPVGEN